jgi:hypothetical protein
MYTSQGISLYSFQKFFRQSFPAFIILNIIVTQQLFAQFTESFSDGEFLNNPHWVGTDSKFGIISNQLKLQAPALSDIAFLSTPSEAINDATWEFSVRMDFNPSSSNFARIYLVSTTSILSDPLNGYFIMVGNTADEVSLYRQEGITKTKIIDGVDGRLNLSLVNLKVKVTRDRTGHWTLYSDIGQTGVYSLEGEAVDAAYETSSFFGIYCEYTSTRSDKFYFDDIIVTGQGYVDDVLPVVETLIVNSSKELAIKFSEGVSEPTAMEVLNYVITGGISPSAVQVISDSTVIIDFVSDFPNGIQMTIDISGVKDLAGNQMEAESRSFLYFQPSPVFYKDVILTEIFPDFNPAVGLPEAEFVELYNRSNNPVQLKGWIFADQTSEGVLPEKILLPGKYVIITSSANVSAYNVFGDCVASSKFPSLNNDGDVLTIKNATRQLIDSISYTDTWYRDDDASEGGVTLELIDPENICAQELNWAASESETGGTPGIENSIDEEMQDLTAPMLLSVTPLSSNTILLKFSERLASVVPSINSIKITPEAEVNQLAFTDQSLTELSVTLKADLAFSILYEIVVNDITDCAGNSMAKTTTAFTLPEQPLPGHIVINEILFNPFPTGVDFIEVYNNSKKYFNVKHLKIGNLYDSAIANIHAASDADLLLAPGSYMVFTTDGNAVANEYPAGHKENFHEVSSLPSMPDDEGAIVLLDSSLNTLDSFGYSKDMHSIYIKDDEGVSLERISFDTGADNRENWKSASSSSGYGTPGYLNSNSKEKLDFAEQILVSPRVISPYSSDQNFTLIQYNFQKAGWVANVIIFDQQGRTVKTVAENVLLGAQGFLRWDGDDDSGEKARIGYYMINFEVFDDLGNLQTIRKAVAIAGKF